MSLCAVQLLLLLLLLLVHVVAVQAARVNDVGVFLRSQWRPLVRYRQLGRHSANRPRKGSSTVVLETQKLSEPGKPAPVRESQLLKSSAARLATVIREKKLP